MMAAGQKVQVIDVRPRHNVSRQQDIVEGVEWRDPERVQEWMGELSKSEPVVVYCAYGFQVGCKTAIKLREAGFSIGTRRRRSPLGWPPAPDVICHTQTPADATVRCDIPSRR